jgi:hypothetical protein
VLFESQNDILSCDVQTIPETVKHEATSKSVNEELSDVQKLLDETAQEETKLTAKHEATTLKSVNEKLADVQKLLDETAQEELADVHKLLDETAQERTNLTAKHETTTSKSVCEKLADVWKIFHKTAQERTKLKTENERLCKEIEDLKLW